MLSAMRRFSTHHPSIYEINGRLWCNELSRELGRAITLAEIPESFFEEISRLGFDFVWLMGAFTTGEEGRRISLQIPALRRAYSHALPGWTDEDVIGSPYAVKEYRVSPALGGVEALLSFRERLRQIGVGLLLDFVPNHTARDNPWVHENPEMYIQALPEEEGDEERFFVAQTKLGPKWLAYGRDPYFPSWTDTAQLNYRHRKTRQTMVGVLRSLAEICDGVRCDMAMLVLSDIIERTWNHRASVDPSQEAKGEFWAEAIDVVKQKHKNFLFIAEAYWDLEWRLMSLGFDYVYDKTLIDRLKGSDAGLIRGHLSADPEYQERLVRFLENHDEPHASALFSVEKHRAAALLALAAPGMRFFHEGQLDGRSVHIPVQLGRRPEEPKRSEVRSFYERLLVALRSEVLRKGRPRLLSANPVWHDNQSNQRLIVSRYDAGSHGQAVIAVNFGATQAQCRVPLQLRGVEGRTVELTDALSEERFIRDGDELIQRGLYLDMAPWQAAIYWVRPLWDTKELIGKAAE